MIKNKLLRLPGLAAELGVPQRTIQSLYHSRKIPYIRAGHRTIFFDPEKVRLALERLEVHAVS